MRGFIKLFLFSFVCILTSCKLSSDDNVEIVNLNGKSVSQQSEWTPIYQSNNISISRGWNKPKGYYCNTIAKNNNSVPELLFKVGHGHNEFYNLTFGQGSDNSLLLLDDAGTDLSLTVVPMTDSIQGMKDDKKWKKYDLSRMDFTSFGGGFCALSDSTLLRVGSTSDNRHHIFSIMDFKNKNVIPLEFWPDDGMKIADFPKFAVYTENAKLYGNKHNRFYYECSSSRYSFIFSIEDKKINIIKQLHDVFPKYYSPDGANYRCVLDATETKERMTSVCTDKYIFILLMEWVFRKEDLDKPRGEDILEVFDWNGNKIKEFHVDHQAERMMLSKDNKTIYFIAPNRNKGCTVVWSYDIASLK